MEPVPSGATTVITSRPVKFEGRLALIAVLVHDVTCRIWPVEVPVGVATTLQVPHNEEPNVAPVMVIVVPALTTRPEVLNSGVTDRMAVFILISTAEK